MQPFPGRQNVFLEKSKFCSSKSGLFYHDNLKLKHQIIREACLEQIAPCDSKHKGQQLIPTLLFISSTLQIFVANYGLGQHKERILDRSAHNAHAGEFIFHFRVSAFDRVQSPD